MTDNRPSEVKAPDRIQQNLLARGERRLLNYLCAHLPAWMTPDKLTSIGFLGAIMVAVGYALSGGNPLWLALSIIGYVVNWFGDSLDGSLARWRKIERPRYGYFLDHSVDGLAIFLMVGGLGLTPYIRFDVALICVVCYLLLAIHTFLAAKVLGEFRLSYLAGGPTELRIMLMVMTGLMPLVGAGDVGPMNMTPFDLFAIGVAAILLTLFVVQSYSTAKILRSQESKPRA
jgi:phosphatidylglycerophosphate synthase